MRRRWRDLLITFLIAKMRKMPSTPDESKNVSCFWQVFSPEVIQKSIQARWVIAPQSWQTMFELEISVGSSVRRSQQSWARASQAFRSLWTERIWTWENVGNIVVSLLWTLLICSKAACLLCIFLLKWSNPSDMTRHVTDKARHTYGKYLWPIFELRIVSKKNQAPLTEYQ